jgi:hypothetical protein
MVQLQQKLWNHSAGEAGDSALNKSQHKKTCGIHSKNAEPFDGSAAFRHKFCRNI